MTTAPLPEPTVAVTNRTARDYLIAASALMGLASELDDQAAADLAAARAIQFEQAAAELPPAHRSEAWHQYRPGCGDQFGWSCLDCPAMQASLLDAVAAQRAAEWHGQHPDGMPADLLVPACGSEFAGTTLLLVCDLPIGHDGMHRMSYRGQLPPINWRRANG